jgi:hypothetical protein
MSKPLQAHSVLGAAALCPIGNVAARLEAHFLPQM